MANDHDFVSFEPINHTITFVSESGVMAVPMGTDNSPVVCRRQFPGAFVNLDAPDGIRAEMAENRSPVPWHSEKERDAAVETIREDRWLNDEERHRIIGHILGTAHYEWD
jgi:hypothetical protein